MRVLVPAAITASDTAAGYAASNMGNDHAGVVWMSPSGLGGVTIFVDFGAGNAQAPDAALFFGCTGASTSWIMTIQSADDAAFSVNAANVASNVPFLAGATFPAHGRGVGYWEASGVVTARRYWKFVIQSLGSLPVTIARLALGNRILLERNFSFGAGFGVRDLGRVDWTRAGVRLRTRGAKLRTVGLTFSNVRKDEVETKVQPLIEIAAGQEPIVLVTDPAASAQRQTRCFIGHMIGELGTIWASPAGWEWKAQLVDLIPVPKASA
jgi:hypothetical protein